MIGYKDFSLRFESRLGEAYPIRVDSPAGQVTGEFHLPFDVDKIDDILSGLGRAVRASDRLPSRQLRLLAAARTRPKEIGGQLFNALFCGVVRDLLLESLGMIRGSQYGLRIMLHIDPKESTLASLPWEFLYWEEKDNFLNLGLSTPVVRFLHVQQPYTPPTIEPPLRILVVISGPRGYAKLDLDKERDRIETEWARYENVQVEFMERPTIEALHDKLAEQQYRYHVLHYMGHGDFDEETGQGVLVLEGEDGQATKKDGQTLGTLLGPARSMRLVFLNACETAKIARKNGVDPFAGVASALIMAGMPAVVAMQFPISDDAAIKFAGTFYARLAGGDPVDTAVAEGRRRIYVAAKHDTSEWGTPVLFMRVSEGIIFRVGEAHRPAYEDDDSEMQARLESAQREAEAEHAMRTARTALARGDARVALREARHAHDFLPNRGEVLEVLWQAEQAHGQWVARTRRRLATVLAGGACVVLIGLLLWGMRTGGGPLGSWFWTPTPSPTATVKPMPTFTPTRLPTNTPTTTPSLEPTFTGTSTATSTHRATPRPTSTHTTAPTATPTLPLSPTPVPIALLAPPVLESPAAGADLGGETITFRWKWDRGLKENEHFDVRVWQEGTEARGISWADQTWYEARLSTSGKHYWSILVLRHTGTRPDGTKLWEPVSEESEVRWFTYSPPGPPGPTPTRTPKI